MTRSRATARKAGTAWETEVVRALRDSGWPHAERRRLEGARDRGDITGVPGVVIECKSTNRLALAEAVDEAEREGTIADAHVAVAWIKRKGRAHAEDGYVVLTGEQFLALLADAGYGGPGHG